MAASMVLVPLPAVRAEPATRLVRIPIDTARAVAATATGAASGGVATPFPLSHLAAQGTGDHDAAIDVRWMTGGGAESQWQPWQRLSYDADVSEGSGQT